jgi:hypothetical protein
MGRKMQDNLLERLRTFSDVLEEAADHIETLEAIMRILEKTHPQALDSARATVAATRKNQHP